MCFALLLLLASVLHIMTKYLSPSRRDTPQTRNEHAGLVCAAGRVMGVDGDVFRMVFQKRCNCIVSTFMSSGNGDEHDEEIELLAVGDDEERRSSHTQSETSSQLGTNIVFNEAGGTLDGVDDRVDPPVSLVALIRAWKLSLPSLKDVASHIPISTWLPQYQWRSSWSTDMINGLTLGIMMVPQGMAYAILAGLPPIYGLYSSFVVPLIYMLFGESRHVSMGTFALTSMLLKAAVAKVVADETDTAAVISAAMTITLCVGVLQLVMAALRLGFFAAYLSPPLTSGFTTAAAVYIATRSVGH